jgi:hypothetical protein
MTPKSRHFIGITKVRQLLPISYTPLYLRRLGQIQVNAGLLCLLQMRHRGYSHYGRILRFVDGHTGPPRS